MHRESRNNLSERAHIGIFDSEAAGERAHIGNFDSEAAGETPAPLFVQRFRDLIGGRELRVWLVVEKGDGHSSTRTPSALDTPA